MYIAFFRRKNSCQFISKFIYIIPEWDPFSRIIHTIQQIMLNHINRFFQTIENKTMRIKTFFTKTI